jgi:hypothetical protein
MPWRFVFIVQAKNADFRWNYHQVQFFSYLESSEAGLSKSGLRMFQPHLNQMLSMWVSWQTLDGTPSR